LEKNTNPWSIAPINNLFVVLLTRERETHTHKEKKKGGWGERIESFHFLHQLRKQGVCHIVALPFTLKSILRQKEELWKLKYFTMQKYNLQKILQKKTKIFQDIIITLL